MQEPDEDLPHPRADAELPSSQTMVIGPFGLLRVTTSSGVISAGATASPDGARRLSGMQLA